MDSGDKHSDSMSISVSNFSQHLVSIDQQLGADPLNESLLSLKKDILQFLQIARAQSSDVLDSNPLCPENRTSSNSPSPPTSNPHLAIGDKCSIPYSCYTGEVVSLNCVVMELDSSANSAVVLFTHPTELYMLPCQHFLEGSCRFGDDCRYSHGHRVDVQLIGDYEESDLSQAKQDSACLVYREDEKLWNHGVIMRIYEDRCEIWIDRQNEKIDVAISDVFVFQESQTADLYSSGEESDIEIRMIPSFPNKGDEVTTSEVSIEREACWEKHTRGMGSKLMSKMGYVPGTGLGVDSHGRREPIEIVVLPKGKGLDRCMELKSDGTNANVTKKKGMVNSARNKYKRSHQIDKCNESNNMDVFDFLNNSMELQKLVHDENEMREYSIAKKRGKKNVDTSQSRRIVLDKQLRDGRGEVDRLKSSLSRNMKDSVAAKQIETKLKRAERDLSQLEREEGTILDSISSKKQRANMSMF